MVDWKSTTEITKDNLALHQFLHVSLGVYIWEWIISLDFEWQVISKKKPFRWPMIFYFLNRYTLFFSLIGMTIGMNMTTNQIDCQALNGFTLLLGGTAIGFASINLSLRTMAVWSRKWYIVYPLVALILGHFAVLLHGIFLKTEWISGQGCVIINTDNKALAARLVSPSSSSGNTSRLRRLVFQDGLIYFILAFLSNLIATIFMLLNLNAVMSVFANVPAIVVSTIVACRVVRRLSNFNPEAPLPTVRLSSLAFLSHSSGTRRNISDAKGSPKEGVHIQRETFQTPPLEKPVFTESDTRSQSVDGNPSDCEAQLESKGPP